MQITLAVLADYANITAEGKLNIMGVFDVVRANILPSRQPQMRLVFMIEGTYAERDRPSQIEINMQDPNGRTVFAVSGEFILTGGAPGHPLQSHQILELIDTTFRTSGVHTFNIFINRELKRQVPLNVLLDMLDPPAQITMGEG